MALLLEHSIFIHMPKTGGSWLAEALRRANLIKATLGPVHATPAEIQADPSYRAQLPHFAMVRHPASWYASLWAHRMDESWRPITARDWFSTASLDRWAIFTERCEAHTFPEFVRRCVRAFPEGWLTGLYDTYITAGTTVGRFESLIDDTVSILRNAGEEFDETIIRATEPQNVRAAMPSHRRQTLFTPAILDMIHSAECRAYTRFGYDPHTVPLHRPPLKRRFSLIAKLLARISAR